MPIRIVADDPKTAKKGKAGASRDRWAKLKEKFKKRLPPKRPNLSKLKQLKEGGRTGKASGGRIGKQFGGGLSRPLGGAGMPARPLGGMRAPVGAMGPRRFGMKHGSKKKQKKWHTLKHCLNQ